MRTSVVLLNKELGSEGVSRDHQFMPPISCWTGREAKQLRRALRLTVNGFAELLGVHSRTINKWESRLSGITPTPEMQAVLDTALSRADTGAHERFEQLRRSPAPCDTKGGPLEPAAVVGSVGHAHAGLGDIVEFIGSDMATRREFLEISLLTGAAQVVPVRQWSVSAPIGPFAQPNPGQVEGEALGRADEVCRRWDESGGGGSHRYAVLGQLSAVAQTRRNERRADVQQRLSRVVGGLAQLAGFMSWDAGLPEAAQRYFLFGLDACEHGGAFDLGGKIIGDMAQLSESRGHYEDGLSMVRTALASLPRSANPLVRSELHGHEACLYARLGREEETAARRAVDASLDAFDRSTSDAYRTWNEYMDRAEVECLASTAYTQLGLREPKGPKTRAYAQQAEGHTLRATADRPRHRLRVRLFDELRLSKVRLVQNEPEEASALAQRVVSRAPKHGSSSVLDSLITQSQRLTVRFGDVVQVRDFRDRLAAHVRDAAPGREKALA